MALNDLSKVTQMLVWLIQRGIENSAGWSGPSFTVSPLPPDKLQDAGANLGFYLYHIAEDPHFKNQVPAGTGAGGMASKPLGLSLYYQLTAQVSDDDDQSAYRAQRLMGIAIRVLHDHASINDGTTIYDGTSDVPLLARAPWNLEGRQNRIRVTLRPVPADDAVDYWTAGSAPLRLAAYYQVSVVFLDAEPEPAVAGPVLSYASPVFASGAPMLTGSRATLSILVGADTTASSVLVQPAQVSLSDGSAGSGRFELLGTSLTGAGTALRLRGERWTKTVDPSLWGVVASGDRVSATVRASIDDVETVPGVYNASVVVTKSVSVGGRITAVEHPSNETPLVVTPRIAPISGTGPTLGGAAPGANVTVNGWLFVHADIPEDAIDPRAVRVYVGETLLAATTTSPAPPGTFRVVGPTSLQLGIPADVPVGAVLPVRVSVNRAMSAPVWLRVDAP